MKSFRRIPREIASAFRACLSLCLLVPMLVSVAYADDAAIKVDPEAAKNYLTLAKGVSPARLSQTISDLSSLHYNVLNQPLGAPVTAYSRVAGTPGGDLAFAYVRQQFRQIFGTANTAENRFPSRFP